MVAGELSEHALAFRGELDEHTAAVLDAAAAPDKAARFEAVEQLDGAVMAELETFGEIADGDFLVRRRALRGEHELVLLRLESGFTRGVFAEAKEEPQLVAKLGE